MCVSVCVCVCECFFVIWALLPEIKLIDWLIDGWIERNTLGGSYLGMSRLARGRYFQFYSLGDRGDAASGSQSTVATCLFNVTWCRVIQTSNVDLFVGDGQRIHRWFAIFLDGHKHATTSLTNDVRLVWQCIYLSGLDLLLPIILDLSARPAQTLWLVVPRLGWHRRALFALSVDFNILTRFLLIAVD